MELTPPLSRAARAMLGWSQQELADAAKVSKQTLVDFERGARTPYERTLRDVVQALEDAGIAFIAEDDEGGAGLRFRDRTP